MNSKQSVENRLSSERWKLAILALLALVTESAMAMMPATYSFNPYQPRAYPTGQMSAYSVPAPTMGNYYAQYDQAKAMNGYLSSWGFAQPMGLNNYLPAVGASAVYNYHAHSYNDSIIDARMNYLQGTLVF